MYKIRQRIVRDGVAERKSFADAKPVAVSCGAVCHDGDRPMFMSVMEFVGVA
jgi:hypothetical protein